MVGIINFPYVLRYEPHPDVKDLFPTTLQDDDPMAYIHQLLTVPKDATLYTIYAMDAPVELGGREKVIGTLKLNGNLVNSYWADKNLFFRHQRMDDDLNIHQEWKPYTP